MINYLRKTLELMRKRAEHNLEIIRMNDQIAKAMLEEPFSESRSGKIEERYQENKKLLKENNDSMQIQLEITRFIENYYHELKAYDQSSSGKFSKQQKKTSPGHTKAEILDLTIKEEIPFNEHHPFFRDEDFFNRLLDYYKKQEDYETCHILINKRKKKT